MDNKELFKIALLAILTAPIAYIFLVLLLSLDIILGY